MRKGLPELITMAIAVFLPQPIVTVVHNKIYAGVILIIILAVIYILLKQEQIKEDETLCV